jgi:hypothetical protein
MKTARKLAYYRQLKVFKTEVCQHDKATGPISDEQ